MMLVRLLVGLSGPDYTLSPGDEREFSRAEAVRLIEAGFAVPVAEVTVEAAVAAPAPERRKRGRPRIAD